MNTYRVDRNDSVTRVPVGMNSLLYVGDSLTQARRAYLQAKAGLTSWGNEDQSVGVTLSKWDSLRRQYYVLEAKGIQHSR